MADDQTKNVKSVSAGGESVSIDTNAQKADERAEQNDSLENIANRRVRPYFVGCRIRNLPGWH